jgi:hypothetical protein
VPRGKHAAAGRDHNAKRGSHAKSPRDKGGPLNEQSEIRLRVSYGFPSRVVTSVDAGRRIAGSRRTSLSCRSFCASLKCDVTVRHYNLANGP